VGAGTVQGRHPATPGHLADAYCVRGTPTAYLIGRDGSVDGGVVGPRPWTQLATRAILDALLHEPAGASRP